MAVVSIKNKLRRGNLLVGNEAYDPGSFVSIATVTVGSGGAANIEFTSIPSTYSHLQIRGIARGTKSSTVAFLNMKLNSDTGTNYAYHVLQGDGASAVAAGYTNDIFMDWARYPAASATASIFGASIIDILDYGNTNKFKTVRYLGNYDANGSGYLEFRSGLWRSTSAISTITFSWDSGNFAQYSSFALYGIKVA
jgi:hypothetical protein